MAVVALGLMLWWELSTRNKHPIVDFRVLKHRDLAGSIFLFMLLLEAFVVISPAVLILRRPRSGADAH